MPSVSLVRQKRRATGGRRAGADAGGAHRTPPWRAGRCASAGPRGVGDRAVRSPDTRPTPIEIPILLLTNRGGVSLPSLNAVQVLTFAL